MDVGIILLAAGESKRMGRCKLLMPWKGKTVFDAICGAIEPIDAKKIVVLGQWKEEMEPMAATYGLPTVVNNGPEKGQSYSLKLALEALPLESLSGVLCVAADQPLLSTVLMQDIIRAYAGKGEKAIICPRYGDKPGLGEIGNPVFFGAYWFASLANLKGDVGGRSIVRGEGRPHVSFVFASTEQGMDLDTIHAYNALFEKYGKK